MQLSTSSNLINLHPTNWPAVLRIRQSTDQTSNACVCSFTGKTCLFQFTKNNILPCELKISVSAFYRNKSFWLMAAFHLSAFPKETQLIAFLDLFWLISFNAKHASQADVYQLLRRDRAQQTVGREKLCSTFLCRITLINCETCSWKQAINGDRICQEPASVGHIIFRLEVQLQCHCAIFLLQGRKCGSRKTFQVAPRAWAQLGPVLLHFVGNVAGIVCVNHFLKAVPSGWPNRTIVIKKGKNETWQPALSIALRLNEKTWETFVCKLCWRPRCRHGNHCIQETSAKLCLAINPRLLHTIAQKNFLGNTDGQRGPCECMAKLPVPICSCSRILTAKKQ